jgi:hypothetical protein
MRKLIALLTFSASGLLAQTMILTPSYITTLKARAAANTPEWQVLRAQCDWLVQYTAGTPDHLPPVYASTEYASDGRGNGNNGYILIGTLADYEGSTAEVYGLPLGVCYLTLKDGDVTPSGWSYSWNGISLTAQQYGVLAGIQAVKMLNKMTPTFARITPATQQSNWGGLPWRPVGGPYYARMNRYAGNSLGIFGSVDAYVENAQTSAPTSAGSNVLYFTSTTDSGGNPDFTVGHVAIGTNIPAGTTVLTVTPNTSITLSANVTGSGVASGALIADTPSGNNCSAAGQAPVFVGLQANQPAIHAPIVLSNILGPLGTQLNGNTYYVSSFNYGATPYGFWIDTTIGGGTLVCTAPNQGTDYKGNPVGSGQNYNHDPQAENEYPDRFFLTGMAFLYDWLHPLLAQSPAAAISQLAAVESTAVKATFSGYPWSQTTYPQAIPTAYSTLQAQVLDSMDGWTREQVAGYLSGNDVGSFVQVPQNYHWGHYAGLGLAAIAACHGSANCASPDDARATVWYDYWRNYLHLAVSQPYTARWFGPQGNQMDSWNYLPTSVTNIVLTLVSNITAMGDDLVTNVAQPFPWIVGLEYYKHNLEPGGKSMLERGYQYYSGAPPCPNCVGSQALMAVQYLADLENAPLKNKFRNFVQGLITSVGEGGDNPVLPFLFWDPSATQTIWNDEPLVLGNMANPAGGYGHVYMRSDWSTTGTYLSFEARPYVFDWGNTKDTLDSAGSILVQRGNNYLTVNPSAECQHQAPADASGPDRLGTNINYATQACYNAFNYYTLAYAGGYYRIDHAAGVPSKTTSEDSVVLTTNGATSSGGVLSFASTTGVAFGQIAIGASIPQFAYVIGITSTTVTLNQSVTGGGVSNGESVTFAQMGTYNTGGAMGVWNGASGGTQGGNFYYGQPGYDDDNPPMCTGPGAPYVPGSTYTVSSNTVTVKPTSPLTDGWANGTPLTFSWASTATPPTYYLSGSSGATESVQPGVLYNLINWNGGTGTFGIIKGPTTYPNNNQVYPTSGTALVFATAGSGTNIIHGGRCNSVYHPGFQEMHPARVDLLESTTNYAYARGVGLEADYGGNISVAGNGGGRVIASQREVLYLTPKLFLVYDRTRQSHWNQQAVVFNSLVDTDGTNPAYVMVNAGHTFHSGMQVKITGCANTTVNNHSYTITVLDAWRFALNGQMTTIGGTLTGGTATGNLWGTQVMPWHTGAKPIEVTSGLQAAAGMRQWHVKEPAVNIASISATSPVTVTTSAFHNLNTGVAINVAGVTGGCSGLNGVWVVTVGTGSSANLTTFTLNGSTSCGASGAVGTIQKFNGAITSILPKTPGVVLTDFVPLLQSSISGAGYTYRLVVHDPRDCTSNPTWCLTSGADTADSQNWLTALDAAQSATDTAALAPLTGTNADMVQVGTYTVAGFQNARVAAGNCANSTCTPPAPVLPISYTFTQPVGIVNHYLAGVTPGATYYVNASTPGSLTISSTGSAGATQASANGILSFATQNGVGSTVTTISGPLQIRGSGSIQ